ncbi:MAG: galactose mutarotase [Sedimentisphaerales bacterium]|nr:galactose mutarotase [Sedimentisphaerales bacterium]
MTRNDYHRFYSVLVCMAVLVTGCENLSQSGKNVARMSIAKADFGKTQDGQQADIYTLTNANGLVVKITNYGGTITELWTPDRKGNLGDIVLGFDNLKDYEEKSPYFGCLIGRYGNRIAKGKFTLDGQEYTLAVNNGKNHLHGGLKGFDKVVWEAEPFQTDEAVGLKLHYLSKDMEEGYPGNLDVNVVYTLTNKNTLAIDYEATTDKPTVCNLTNHNYYNLAGQGIGSNYENQLMINADYFTPVDEGLIPTAQLRSVEGTPMDFTQMTAIGKRIDTDTTQLKYGGGYDHNWVLNKENENEMSLAAKVYEPKSGREMAIFTTEPAIQFYSGNFLDGTLVGKEGRVYKHRNAYCLETQHYPDSPNHAEFPSTVLRPGQIYKTTTIHKFSVK